MRGDPRLRLGLVAVVALGAGYAAGAWLRSAPPAPPPVEARRGDERERVDALAGEIAALQAALDQERGLRGGLELEVAMLRRELEARGRSGGEPAPLEPAGPAATDVAVADAPPRGAEGTPAEWFDAAGLRSLGVGADRAERLRGSFESLQMDELYLRDRATREGWVRKPAYFQQVQDMRNQLRESLGAEDYDLMLYASGRDNRVLVRGVLQNSPAAAAGIEAGDIILRYDDAPILEPRDLTRATASGKAGSSVAVDVLHDGEEERVYLRRGPLGAQILPTRRPPAE